MEKTKRQKTISYYMRILHRDIGFLLIGLTLVFCLSGIALVYRETDFLKVESQMSFPLRVGLKADELGDEMHLRRVQVVKQDERFIYFNDEPFAKDGKYDQQTGVATYLGKDYVFPLNKFAMLHLATNLTSIHWFIVLYGILLSFLSVSSLWMFKIKTAQFRRGLTLTCIGFVGVVALIAAL